jgi:hypothetical protein
MPQNGAMPAAWRKMMERRARKATQRPDALPRQPDPQAALRKASSIGAVKKGYPLPLTDKELPLPDFAVRGSRALWESDNPLVETGRLGAEMLLPAPFTTDVDYQYGPIDLAALIPGVMSAGPKGASAIEALITKWLKKSAK